MVTLQSLREKYYYDPTTGLFFYNNNRNESIGYKTKPGYLRIPINRKYFLIHRLIWIYMTGESPKIIDHINGIKDDNRWCNLRNVDQTVNCQNTRKQKGAYYRKNRNKWIASITYDKKTIWLGSFDTYEEAYEVYLNAKKIYHPTFIIEPL